MQLKHPGTAVLLAAALLTPLAWAGEAAKPVKVTAASAAGEAVLIPKGWKGRWTTPGYSKYYVVYDTK